MEFEDDLNQQEIHGQWLRLQTAIEKKQPTPGRRPGMPYGAWKKYLGIAASLLLLVIASLWFGLYSLSTPVVYKTGNGQQRYITLPDSSRVILNANSSISYDQSRLERGDREVTLSGEAFFAVVHTADDRSFTVHTSDGMRVQVLGTEFNVYDRRGMQRVVLNSGSVRLHYDSLDAIGMRPGEMVIRRGRTAAPKKTRVEPARYSAWTQGRLVFENTPLPEVCRQIRDNFGLIVSLPDKTLDDRLFNGTFPANNATVLLKAIMTTYQLEMATRVETGGRKNVQLRRKRSSIEKTPTKKLNYTKQE